MHLITEATKYHDKVYLDNQLAPPHKSFFDCQCKLCFYILKDIAHYLENEPMDIVKLIELHDNARSYRCANCHSPLPIETLCDDADCIASLAPLDKSDRVDITVHGSYKKCGPECLTAVQIRNFELRGDKLTVAIQDNLGNDLESKIELDEIVSLETLMKIQVEAATPIKLIGEEVIANGGSAKDAEQAQRLHCIEKRAELQKLINYAKIHLRVKESWLNDSLAHASLEEREEIRARDKAYKSPVAKEVKERKAIISAEEKLIASLVKTGMTREKAMAFVSNVEGGK